MTARRRTALRILRVAALPGQRWRGRMVAGSATMACVLGPAGVTWRKREGDGATPAGRYGFERLLFRGDRILRPRSGLPGRALDRCDGWCDDQTSACYNRAVRLPFAPSHERLWREDRLYDLLAVLTYNRVPIRKALGSAIFLHACTDPPAPTAGCVAVEARVLRKLIARIDRHTRIIIA